MTFDIFIAENGYVVRKLDPLRCEQETKKWVFKDKRFLLEFIDNEIPNIKKKEEEKTFIKSNPNLF